MSQNKGPENQHRRRKTFRDHVGPVILRQTSGFLTSFWTNFEQRLNHPSHGGFVRNTSERTTVQAMNEKKSDVVELPNPKIEVASNKFPIGKPKASSCFSSHKPP